MKLPKRNHMNNVKNLKLDFNRKYRQSSSSMKPSGFWYACYSSWYNWTQENDMFIGKYIHKINITPGSLRSLNTKDNNGLLVINNVDDLLLFDKRYKETIAWYYPFDKKRSRIDWKKVSQDYGGIEICPYLGDRLIKEGKWRRLEWYWSWDVASGCIWNTTILKNTELLYQRVKKKGRRSGYEYKKSSSGKNSKKR